MPTYPPAGSAGGNILSPDYGRPTGRAPVPLVGFIDPLEAIEAASELAQNSWRQVIGMKAADLRAELTAQAVAASAYGAKLPFPGNFVAGLVGKSLVQPGTLSFTEYAGLATALNAQLLSGRSVLSGVAGFGGKFVRFATGPAGLVITGVAVARYQAFPSDPDRSLGWVVLENLLTAGINDFLPAPRGDGPAAAPGTLAVAWLGPEEPLVPEEQLQLLAFWTKDDP